MRLGLWVALASMTVLLACDPDEIQVSESADETSETGTGDASSTGDEPTGTTAAEEVCADPLLECGELCVDTRWDPANCGGCEIACGDEVFCVEGTCELVCGPGTLACDGACADTEVDPDHCGECGHACPDGAACVDGGCVLDCADDETQCAESCVDLDNDEAHCGDCGQPCADEVFCVFGECVDASVHHLMITGQSLSVGQQSPVVSTTQPFANVTFLPGVRASTSELTDFVPLVETEDGIFGETIGSGMANLLTELSSSEAGDGLRVLVSAHGVSSASYEELAKGSGPYLTGMAHAFAGESVAEGRRESYAVRGVVAIHGERDHVEGNPFYADNLVTWQEDYEADVQAMLQQSHPVPLFLCQMSSWTHYDTATSQIPAAQLEASRSRPDRIFVVAPKYFLPYVDGLHLTGEGERQLGEYYAKAMDKVLVDGERWVPLAPREVNRVGAIIDIAFDVPAPPLVLDEVAVSNPGNYGFEYTDASGAPPEIASVVLTGDTTLRITLSETPTAGGRRIRYAHTGIPGNMSGATTGPRGNLRDSDPTPSRHGYPLHNWSVHFDEPVP